GRVVRQSLPAAINHARLREGFTLAILVKQVGAEKSTLSLLKKNPCIPAMWQLRSWVIAEAIFPGCDLILWAQDTNLLPCEVIDIDQRPDHSAGRLSMTSNRHPFLQRSALVRFEMTPTDPAQPRRIDDLAQAFPHFREHPTH